MSANTFGKRFCVTTFGESHGVALGCVIDGCPAGIAFDHDLLVRELARRKPGASAVVSSRNEADVPEVLCGVYEGKTLGTPIAIIVRNRDARPEDYLDIAKAPRPGHADDTWRIKFGHVDPRGGGRASGRETVARVMAGAVAQMVARVALPKTQVLGRATAIGPCHVTDEDFEKNVQALLLAAKEEGKSYGGVVEIGIDNLPAGLGAPVFHKFKADLGAAYLGVGATSAVEIGEGFDAAAAQGTEFHRRPSDAQPYGGLRGGITTGERIVARVAFKPPASVLEVAKKGRHDPCIVLRAIPILEAMTWIVIADQVLFARTDRAL